MKRNTKVCSGVSTHGTVYQSVSPKTVVRFVASALASPRLATHKETKIRTSVKLFLTQTPETRLMFYHELALIMQTLQRKLLHKVKLVYLFSTDWKCYCFWDTLKDVLCFVCVGLWLAYWRDNWRHFGGHLSEPSSWLFEELRWVFKIGVTMVQVPCAGQLYMYMYLGQIDRKL